MLRDLEHFNTYAKFGLYMEKLGSVLDASWVQPNVLFI